MAQNGVEDPGASQRHENSRFMMITYSFGPIYRNIRAIDVGGTPVFEIFETGIAGFLTSFLSVPIHVDNERHRNILLGQS